MSAQATGHNLPQWTLGERLQKARTHAGLSRDDMAERLGISRNTVINYETDKTHPTERRKRLWAMVTGVPVEWLEGVVTVRFPRRGRSHLTLVPTCWSDAEMPYAASG